MTESQPKPITATDSPSLSLDPSDSVSLTEPLSMSMIDEELYEVCGLPLPIPSDKGVEKPNPSLLTPINFRRNIIQL